MGSQLETQTFGEALTEIILDENDKLEWAIKTFRRKVQRSGVLQDLRNKRYYVKPSLAKRLKTAAALRRKRRAARKRRG
jgi:small subunit ribosomal protein S21